jgi:hypothetical protein
LKTALRPDLKANPLFAVRQKTKLLSGIKLILPVQSCLKKYSDLPKVQISLYRLPSRSSQKGRFAIVTDVGAGCGGREVAP